MLAAQSTFSWIDSTSTMEVTANTKLIATLSAVGTPLSQPLPGPPCQGIGPLGDCYPRPPETHKVPLTTQR